MKYMLLIYQNPAGFEALSEEERSTVFEDVDTIVKELTESGEWIGGDGLADLSQTKTVKVRDGVPAGARPSPRPRGGRPRRPGRRRTGPA